MVGFEPARPVLVVLAEPGIAEGLGRAVAVFLPQQHERDARPAQFAMDQGPIGLAALLGGQIRGRRIEPVLQQDIIIELGRQRPGQAGAPGAVDVFADGALGQAQAGSGGALGEPDSVVQA